MLHWLRGRSLPIVLVDVSKGPRFFVNADATLI